MRFAGEILFTERHPGKWKTLLFFDATYLNSEGVESSGCSVNIFSMTVLSPLIALLLDRFEATQDSTYYTSGFNHETNADNFLSWAILTSLVSVLDAYIDAHLYRFEEKVRIDEDGAVEVSVKLY